MTETLNVADIEMAKELQLRKIDKTVVVDYAEAMKDGVQFPPIHVFREKGSERALCADGFHRIHASERAGIEEIDCEVYEGSPRDAFRFALSCNTEHGLRRTRKDLANIIEKALLDPEFGKWSNRRIADLCACNEKSVRNRRQDLVLAGKLNPKETVIGKDGVEQSTGADIPHHEENEENQPPKSIKPKRKSREERDRDEFMGYVKGIRTVPYSGVDAVEKLPGLRKHVKEIRFARDWLTELLGALEAD